ncbi:hypothetical protein C8Q80DRAFT_1266683 [Daedaleopsis nitida]|nr:hypothetical protein C8Q80DRAFT_1266683 [Daedaleopsis nitida]
MVKIEVFDFEDYEMKTGPRAAIDFSNAPIDAILDTAASVSFVPSDIIKFMRTEVFGTFENKQLHEERGDRGASIGDLKPDSKRRIDDPAYDIKNMAVRLHFDTLRGQSVHVTLPVSPFLCAKENRMRPQDYEGLLFTNPDAVGKEKRTCILGTNFLQASLVSLVNPSINGCQLEATDTAM